MGSITDEWKLRIGRVNRWGIIILHQSLNSKEARGGGWVGILQEATTLLCLALPARAMKVLCPMAGWWGAMPCCPTEIPLPIPLHSYFSTLH